MKLTRRKLVPALAAGTVLAQAPSSQAPSAADAELQAARDQLKANLTRLAAQSIPMDTEPAFQFKA